MEKADSPAGPSRALSQFSRFLHMNLLPSDSPGYHFYSLACMNFQNCYSTLIPLLPSCAIITAMDVSSLTVETRQDMFQVGDPGMSDSRQSLKKSWGIDNYIRDNLHCQPGLISASLARSLGHHSIIGMSAPRPVLHHRCMPPLVLHSI